MKKTTHDYTEPVAKQHYKKKYLVRKFEELEAEQEIKDYENCTDESGTSGFDGERPDNSERRASKLS